MFPFGFQYGLSKFRVPQVHVHDADAESGQFLLAQADGVTLQRRAFELFEQSPEYRRPGNREWRVLDVQFERTAFDVRTRQNDLLDNGVGLSVEDLGFLFGGGGCSTFLMKKNARLYKRKEIILVYYRCTIGVRR